MKRYRFVVLFVLSLLLAGCTHNKPNPSPSPTASSTPQPTSQLTPTTETPEQAKANLAEAISQLFIQKYGWEKDSFTVTVSQIEGSYSKGSVKSNEEQSGGMWFAAKDKGGVYLVYDGNGVITCESLTDYPNFPQSMIPECYNSQTGKTVKR